MGRAVTCSGSWVGSTKLGSVCRGTQGQPSALQHTVKRNPESFISCVRSLLSPGTGWGLCFSVASLPALYPDGHPRPQAIKPQTEGNKTPEKTQKIRKFTSSCTTSTLYYTSAIIWRSFQALLFPPYITVSHVLSAQSAAIKVTFECSWLIHWWFPGHTCWV